MRMTFPTEDHSGWVRIATFPTDDDAGWVIMMSVATENHLASVIMTPFFTGDQGMGDNDVSRYRESFSFGDNDAILYW